MENCWFLRISNWLSKIIHFLKKYPNKSYLIFSLGIFSTFNTSSLCCFYHGIFINLSNLILEENILTVWLDFIDWAQGNEYILFCVGYLDLLFVLWRWIFWDPNVDSAVSYDGLRRSSVVSLFFSVNSFQFWFFIKLSISMTFEFLKFLSF